MSETTYDEYETYEQGSTVETPADAQDVAALIAQGLADLGQLKAEVSAAETVVEQTRATADERVAEYKAEAAEAISEARNAATAEVERVKAETDEQVAEVRAEANEKLAAGKKEQAEVVAAAVQSADEVKARYAEHINHLIQTGWATPGALASMGHAVPRGRGGRKPSK